MAAASSRALFSRFTDFSPFHHHQPPPYTHHLLLRPSPPSKKRLGHVVTVNCLISGVDGGGVSDEFVSTQRNVSFDREFSVIANMLKKIEPLDCSVISNGVSDAAKDSMKQTISTMLGLLPSDQFTVMVRVSKRPLDRLLSSSFITGYTLWNAEYRIMLMRNFEVISSNDVKRLNSGEDNEASEEKVEKSECSCDDVFVDCCTEEAERLNLQNCLGDLAPEALNYIKRLESEISIAKKELHARKQENTQIEDTRESDNDLLKYLRSLDPDMVNELSRPSSSEVEEVIRELVQCTSRRFFKEEITSDSSGDSDIGTQENFPHDIDDISDTIGTSRDYLAKLLFWCMLLGHHLRGLENRLHLSCAVGLL
ncbi:hypothetical protein HanXRQr2_Chr17g0798461 [Helianthus annuus]|uniref:Uncharacterized protein n=1 Tax=Helianthus annuus TaxID=4232 RepID=A0A251RP38_HELAN|nr:uncharacterized protein LOC110920750 [Helianthus annuus]KAF5755070.1 hypothetical protein HanXRQr2_Chr17g0798461 [Helianthus annuus]KAJ0428851.1 hypothetical protein HanHA300_Chr17g0650711 [Helianthus annuus]KAJ0635978.1 hypothetical protein HanOQP8_Chr17g0656761 [Helianthus annuus]KAJ0824026.1 hypothetical protein HanLR1_Chr00c0098g0709661 [Helianthus annuus]